MPGESGLLSSVGCLGIVKEMMRRDFPFDA